MERPDGPVLALRVTRTGGFAGLRRQWDVAADTDDEARVWWPLVEACPWDSDPGECTPDGFVYEVSARDGTNDREATVPEQDLDGPWRHLVDAVRSGHPAP